MKHKLLKKRITLFLLLLLSMSCFLSCAILQNLSNPSTFTENTAEAFKPLTEATKEIEPDEAYYIGREVASIILANYPLYRSPKFETYLNLICMTLVINSDKPEIYNGYHVGILDTDEINAFATSGGHILVTRGLLECAESEDALAGVIAHEIAHIQYEHGIKAIRADRITSATIQTTANVSVGEKRAARMEYITKASEEIVGKMVNSGYSKSQEYDADAFAVELMTKAGYDPNAMCEMLTKMQKKQAGDSRGFGKTHPSAKSRIRKVNRKAKRLNRKHNGEFNRESREARYKYYNKK